ncbi:MAG: hypothetical protein IT383_16990 [Deltaproteobacteria bacterium]|nr:hypothetical protein [Deltaproteobacteria bacterium]
MLTKVRGGNVQRLQAAGNLAEHPQVREALAYLERRAGKGGASSILFYPQQGVRFDAWAFAYDTGLGKQMNIVSAPGKVLRGTLVINASGHANGGFNERVLGWVERELLRQGVRIGDDAKRFRALRDACVSALENKGGNKAGVEVAFAGKTVRLEPQLLDKLRGADLDAGEAALVELAVLGNDTMRKLFAAENTYQVRVRTPDGKVTELKDVPRNHKDKIEYATRIPLELPLVPGETIIEAWPTGANDARTYVEARRYQLHFDKGLFDADKAQDSAARFQEAHPEIRWNTPHEHDDLERHGVSPSPRPYQDF